MGTTCKTWWITRTWVSGAFVTHFLRNRQFARPLSFEVSSLLVCPGPHIHPQLWGKWGGRRGGGRGWEGGSVFSAVLSLRVILNDAGAFPMKPCHLEAFCTQSQWFAGLEGLFWGFPRLGACW